MGERAADVAARLLARTQDLERENAQLQTALDSRVLIEQAKGVLMERLDCDQEAAFLVLRGASRNTSTPLRDLAQAVIASRRSPPGLDAEIERRREAGGDDRGRLAASG